MQNQQRLLNVSHIVIDGLFESVPLLLSFIVVSFGANEKESGVIISLATLCSTLGGLFTVYLSRHWGLLRIISLILFLYGIGFFINTFSQNIYLTGFCFIIAIAGYCLFHNVAFTYLTANSERRLLGKTMGNFTAIGDIGRIPFVSLAGFAAAIYMFDIPGWRIVCFIYGLGAIVFAGYLLFSSFNLSPEKHHALSPTANAKKLFPAFSLLQNKQFALPITANILDAVGSDQIFIFLPYLLLSKGIDPQIMGAFAFAFTLGCLLGKIVCGRMVDLFSTRKVLIISEIVMAILLAVMLLAQQLFMIIGTALLLGMVTKGTVPVIQTIITEPVQEKQNCDDIIAVSSFSRGTMNMLTPLIFGFIASSFGVNWIYVIMIIAAGCAVIPACKMHAY